MIRPLALVSSASVLTVGALALAGPAAAQAPTYRAATSTATGKAAAKAPPPATIHLRIVGGHDHRLPVGGRIKAIGRVRPFVKGQKVEVRVARKGRRVKVKRIAVHHVKNSAVGRFKLHTGPLYKPGPYRVAVVHKPTARLGGGRLVTRPLGIKYPDLDPGDTSNNVKIFTRLLSKRGYYVPHSRHYSSAVGLAVLAYRKVNRMARTEQATPGIFKKLAAGKGGFKLRYPGAGHHVEVDISRQVMTIADHGKPQYTFHVSTGAPATPTITGHYRVYSKDAGYNSEGMYYSSYWHNGYAIHGYDPVPTYNASHGCVRVPIPDAIFIYNRLPIGTSVYTYR